MAGKKIIKYRNIKLNKENKILQSKMSNSIEKNKMNNNKKFNINNIFNSICFVIAIGIMLFLKTLLFYNSTIAINEPLEIETIIGTVAFVAIGICFLCVLPNRLRVIFTLILNLCVSILLFADNIYYIYSNSFLSVAQITNLQYGEEIMKALPMVLDLKQIFYFLDIIIIMILLIFKILIINKKQKSNKKQLMVKCIIGISGIMIFCVVGVNYVERGKQKSYNKDFQIREATIFGYHIYDIENALNIKKQAKYKNYDNMIIDYNNLKDEYETKYGEEKYQLEGILKDKNVIILQLESVQEFVINKEINDKQITPNLNKFLAENIEIKNMNMQSYSTTADSEHSTITSIYPMENGMSFSKYFTNTYDDIFKVFNQANYNTSFMHGNYPYFWNRGNVYGRLGLNALELKEQFEDLSENINGDLSDELLYRQAVQKLKLYDKPFLSYIVAASSHTPYILDGLKDRSKVSIDVGKYKDTYFGNYLEAVNYADYAFGVFLEELKKEGLYDDTAILVFGDHNGINMYNEEMIDFLNYLDNNLTDIDLKLNYTKVVCGIKIPGLEKIDIEKPVSKLDIKPTLTYLCGIEDGFSLGTNMFKSKDFVCLNNERIITSRYYFDEQWYRIDNGEILNLDEISKEERNLLENYFKNMKTELDISQSISINNLLGGFRDIP